MTGKTKHMGKFEVGKSLASAEAGFEEEAVIHTRMEPIIVPDQDREHGMLIPTDLGDIWLTCWKNKKGKLVARATADPEKVMIAQIFFCNLSEEECKERAGKKEVAS